MSPKVSAQRPAPAQVALTPEEAKSKVLGHWQRLDALARRRFPRDENLAHEGLLYVMNQLEADDWRRVRAWQGLAEISSFLAMLCARLLTDFSRMRFGHPRPPAWLERMQDPLWNAAYRVLAVEHYRAQEAIEWLACRFPEREYWFIAEVVSTVRTRCRIASKPLENVKLNHAEMDLVDERLAPEQQLLIEDKEIMETLEAYLQDESAAALSPRVSELLKRLTEQLRLSDEDRLVLRLRFRDGLTVQAIARLLHLQGDPYKSMDKLITLLREAFLRAGVNV